jgi:tetratricopeptide (TPR) repeat protein
MARMINRTTILFTGILATGCAPWSDSQSTNYVTVAPDTSYDTKKARQDYTLGRKLLDKHLQGKECDFVKAENYLKSSLAADVRFGPAHHSLGVLYFWQAKLYLAAWEFEYAARLMPDRFEPLNNLGLIYESTGKYEQAKSFFLLAREKSPHQSEVIANLARASFRNGETVNQMRPVLEDVLASDPRPEWRHWASELLGLNPAEVPEVSSLHGPSVLDNEPAATAAGGENDDSQSAEELPLLSPPQPEAKPLDWHFDGALLLQ